MRIKRFGGKLKIIMGTGAVIILLSVLSLICAAETVTGTIRQTDNSQLIIYNDWAFDTETGMLTITSKQTVYNETGRTEDTCYGSWGKYKTQIKNVVLEGIFTKISNGAFRNCTALESICTTNNVGQVDGEAFSGCSSLKSVYIKDHINTTGLADFRNVYNLGENVFSETKINSIILSKKLGSVTDKQLPTGFTSMYCESNSAAENYALTNGIAYTSFERNVTITLYNGNIKIGTVQTDYASIPEILSPTTDANLYYTDKACTQLFGYGEYLMQSTTVYAKKALSLAGFSVRLCDYHGLRAIYEYNGDIKTGKNIEITEVGAIVQNTDCALSDITKDSDGIRIVNIYNGSGLIGKLLPSPSDYSKKFAVTAIGYENIEGSIDTSRSLTNFAFRGFITLRNNVTGLEQTIYTDAVLANLCTVSRSFLDSSDVGNYSESEIAFVETVTTACRDVGDKIYYTKDDLERIVTDIYKDPNAVMVGQEIDVNETPTGVNDYFYNETGEYPSVLGMDFACYGMRLPQKTHAEKDEYIKQLVAYCRQGGIITASSHFANPTGNWGTSDTCRGLLGGGEYWERLLTEGSDLNNVFKAELDIDAAFLRTLGNNGVPVLWRALHEMNGNWFWWCIIQDGETLDGSYLKRLWQYIYNYYERDLGLDNLLWVYAPNNQVGTCTSMSYCYPGDDYVDMTGIDWYTGGYYEIGNENKPYKQLVDIGKPVAITEFGCAGNYKFTSALDIYYTYKRMKNEGLNVAYIMSWTYTNRIPEFGKGDEFMAKIEVLSRNDVKELFRKLS